MSAHNNKHDEVLQQIKKWAEQKNFKNIRLEEKINREKDPSDDYFVKTDWFSIL